MKAVAVPVSVDEGRCFVERRNSLTIAFFLMTSKAARTLYHSSRLYVRTILPCHMHEASREPSKTQTGIIRLKRIDLANSLRLL